MDEELRRHLQPHLAEAEKLTDAELHEQMRQLDPKSFQCRVYNIELLDRKLRKMKKRLPYFMAGLGIALAMILAGLAFVTNRVLEKGRARHRGHDRPTSQVLDHIP